MFNQRSQEVRLEIAVQNVKCGGCASTIRDALRDIGGVGSVEVDVPTGMVTVEADEDLSDELKQALSRIGYPPKT